MGLRHRELLQPLGVGLHVRSAPRRRVPARAAAPAALRAERDAQLRGALQPRRGASARARGVLPRQRRALLLRTRRHRLHAARRDRSLAGRGPRAGRAKPSTRCAPRRSCCSARREPPRTSSRSSWPPSSRLVPLPERHWRRRRGGWHSRGDRDQPARLSLSVGRRPRALRRARRLLGAAGARCRLLRARRPRPLVAGRGRVAGPGDRRRARAGAGERRTRRAAARACVRLRGTRGDVSREPRPGGLDHRARRPLHRARDPRFRAPVLPEAHRVLGGVLRAERRADRGPRARGARRCVARGHRLGDLRSDAASISALEFFVRKTWFRYYFHGGAFDRFWAKLFPAENTEQGRRSAAYIQRYREKAAGDARARG